MVDALFIRGIIGIIGNVISFGLFLSPAQTFVKIWKKKAVEGFSPMPYLATFMNCAIWVFYGIPFVSESNTLIYTINGIGLLIEAIYLIIFFVFSLKDNRKKITMVLAGETAFMVVVVGVVLGAVKVLKTRTLIVGCLAVFFGTCMYASPLTVMKSVIQTKSVKYMPFTLSLVCFVNGLCWLTFSLLKFDIFVLIPNGLGSLFGLIQLILYFCYYKSTPVDAEENTINAHNNNNNNNNNNNGSPVLKTEVQLASVV